MATTPLSNDERYTLLHVRNSGYVSAVATGAIVTGPTDDGFVHVHFFRESQRILSEDVPVQHADGANLQLDRMNAKLKVHLQREEVATISVSEQIFEEMVRGLVRVAAIRTRK